MSMNPNIPNPHIFYMDLETTKTLCTLVWTELQNEVNQGKKGNDINYPRIEELQKAYTKLRKHRIKLSYGLEKGKTISI